jgi:hypothetical protein
MKSHPLLNPNPFINPAPGPYISSLDLPVGGSQSIRVLGSESSVQELMASGPGLHGIDIGLVQGVAQVFNPGSECVQLATPVLSTEVGDQVAGCVEHANYLNPQASGH